MHDNDLYCLSKVLKSLAKILSEEYKEILVLYFFLPTVLFEKTFVYSSLVQ